jgi:hypothetical protein
MGLATLVNGKKTNNMEKASKLGLTVPVTKECTSREENTEEVVLRGLITALTLVTSWKTTSKGKVSYSLSFLTFGRYLQLVRRT